MIDDGGTLRLYYRGADVSDLAGRAVRLRFVLKDADVHAMQFVP